MNYKQACSLLGIAESASKEEAKKAFRKLAGKHHPDKEGGDAEKFKQINEAYQVIDKGKDFGPSTGGNYSSDVGFDISDIFNKAWSGGFSNPFKNQPKIKQYPAVDKQVSLNISFKESVLGCQKEIKYNRREHCNLCEATGTKKVHNGCNKCDGFGTQSIRQGNMFFQTTCTSCRGSVKTEACKNCNEEGILNKDITLTVNIPAGVKDGKNILKLNNVGDFIGGESFFGSNAFGYANVILALNIEASNLKIENNDVVSNLKISLLEALQGTQKSVETIDGEKEISISALFKNKEEVILPSLGVQRKGNQRVIVEVEYPQNIDALIAALNP